jgi:hypothetical protein
MKPRIPAPIRLPSLSVPRVPHMPTSIPRPKLPKPMGMEDEMAGPSLLEKHLLKRAPK